jgi:hypothetical protein
LWLNVGCGMEGGDIPGTPRLPVLAFMIAIIHIKIVARVNYLDW